MNQNQFRLLVVNWDHPRHYSLQMGATCSLFGTRAVRMVLNGFVLDFMKREVRKYGEKREAMQI